MYVVHAAVVWHPAVGPDAAAAGASSADFSHCCTVCFLQEPDPHGC